MHRKPDCVTLPTRVALKQVLPALAVTLVREVIMPNWMLSCPKCNRQFVHSAIDAKTLESSFFSPKPNFPTSGSELTCPNCQHKTIYQRVELTYHA
jgi:hypothetical protein